MNDHRRPRPGLAAHAAAAAVLLVTACSGPAGPTSAAHAQPTPSATPTPGAAARQQVLGVATSGEMFLIDPHTGTRVTTVTLAAAAATGEEVSVSGDGSTIYYEQHYGCTDRIYSMPAVGGGGPTLVAAGRLPAVSPDGSLLAYTRQPARCTEGGVQYLLVVRNLKTGAETTYPVAPQLGQSGLLFPIDHLSWASDGRRLALSLESPEDDVGWALAILDVRTARYYRTDAPGASVPVAPNQDQHGYYREGVFMPDGNLFVNRVCCEGIHPGGPRVASTLLWEVTTSGALVKQVAIGFTDRDHTSLAADPTGAELLYLSGSDLYVSDGGQRPRLVTGGLLAATFIATAPPR
jgi:hypothetical protein